MIETTDYGLKLQLYEFMKTLIENDFCELFYENSLKIIAQLLSLDLPSDSKLQLNIDEESLVQSWILTLDLINKCILEQNFSIKAHLDKLQIFKIVSEMVQFNNWLINVYVAKFFKCMLASGFKPYVSLLTKQNLLDPLIQQLWNMGKA